MQRNSRILIIGHQDSLENSLWNFFTSRKYSQVYTNSRNRWDVLSQSKVEDFFKKIRPEYVFLASVRSGGIAANQLHGAEFIYENLQAQNNIIHASWKSKVKKLVYFASSCIYPKDARQPIKESSLWQGPMESTSEPYSTAKLAGIKLCQAYHQQYGLETLVIVPATLYGPGSDTNLETAHVMGALIAKFDAALRDNQKEVIVWGTGKPRREFIYVDDFVDGVLFLMKHHSCADIVNLGVGEDMTIKALAQLIAKTCGYKGKITFDASRPDGALRKWLDSSKMRQLGWKPKIGIEQGIKKTYHWYRKAVV